MTEQDVIEQLSRYRQMQARLKVLSVYDVGMGITVSRLNEDDQLQDLHRRLRGQPSYMYLSPREQRLETAAHAYLGGKYPAGVMAQHRAIPREGYDEEDTKLLRELRNKIAKVIAARGYDARTDIDVVLDRLAEYQDLRAEIDRIDTVLSALEQYKPRYAQLLKLRYIDGLEVPEVVERMQISRRTFERIRPMAVAEYCRLSA